MMQQPSPQRLPEMWSVTWKRPLGVGESLVPMETRRRKTTRPSSRSVSDRFGQVGLDRKAHPNRRDRCRARHPADDTVPEHVALHTEPVAAPPDDTQPSHRAERRLPSRHGDRPAGRSTADRDLRASLDLERQRPRTGRRRNRRGCEARCPGRARNEGDEARKAVSDTDPCQDGSHGHGWMGQIQLGWPAMQRWRSCTAWLWRGWHGVGAVSS